MKKKSSILIIFSFLAILLSLLLFSNNYFKKNRTIFFPDNIKGKARELQYDDDFYRINTGEQVVSIAQYGDGFFGAYYSKLYYFNQKNRTVEPIIVPNGFNDLNEVWYNKKDASLIWNPTGIYYDKDGDLLYIANYNGHNVLVCSVELKDGSPEITVNDMLSYNGMKSPENICSKNGVVTVADYDGDALWIIRSSRASDMGGGEKS